MKLFLYCNSSFLIKLLSSPFKFICIYYIFLLLIILFPLIPLYLLTMKGRYLEDTSRPWNQETRTKILQRPPVHFLVPLISKAQSKGNIVILFNLFTCVCVCTHGTPYHNKHQNAHGTPACGNS